MEEFEKILSDIAKSLVDDPEAVTVTRKQEGDSITLTLSVAPDDMGKVIGKQGKIARAIRMVMKSAANISGAKVTVDIRD